MKTIKQSENFSLTKDYFGQIGDDGEGTLIYGFEDKSKKRPTGLHELRGDVQGAVFGYVHEGDIALHDGDKQLLISKGFWFSSRNTPKIEFIGEGFRAVIWQFKNYVGNLNCGLVENEGKLNYIDGCKDTMLHPPIKLGDPCLNALYMPSGVNQTQHTHPSTRSGFIIQGGARCETPEGTFDLEEGEIFFLKKEALHKFRSDHADDIKMKLVAYHPDSDFGPTDEVHPMINRTIVEGVSASKIKEIQTK